MSKCREVDVAHADIRPCIGCEACEFGGKPCVIKDDMEEIKKKVLDAGMLVFATPLYYFTMSVQLKACVDRFCAINPQITEKYMKSVLIVSAYNDDDWTMSAIESLYKTLCKYMDFEDNGMILGIGCGNVGMTKGRKFL